MLRPIVETDMSIRDFAITMAAVRVNAQFIEEPDGPACHGFSRPTDSLQITICCDDNLWLGLTHLLILINTPWS